MGWLRPTTSVATASEGGGREGRGRELSGKNAAVDGGASLEEAKSGLFVDVGANVGWFTANVAARGYRVAAFEGGWI